MPLAEHCKGSILSARVYADTPGFKCECGGTFTKRVLHSDHADLLVPKCTGCDKYPSVFHIDADAKDPNGNKVRVKIRNDQNNVRLTNISQVIFTLQNIQREVLAGEFDVTRYVSKESRESFRFRNYVAAYLADYDLRLENKEITPKGLRDKKSLIKNHLLPFFGHHDLIKINRALITLFCKQPQMKNISRTRDLAMSELRTILRQAVRDSKLKVAPEFDKIPKAKTRTEIISLDLIYKTIEAMPNKLYRDMFTLMTIYPFRPSEIRALRWKDFDSIGQKLITVRGHFSDETWIPGRKSISEGDKATMKYDRSERALAILTTTGQTGSGSLTRNGTGSLKVFTELMFKMRRFLMHGGSLEKWWAILTSFMKFVTDVLLNSVSA